jgi:hypothetical protein
MGDLLLFSQERTQFICNGMNLLVDVLHPDILTHAPERSGRIESPLNSIYAARPRIPVCRVHSLFSICKTPMRIQLQRLCYGRYRETRMGLPIRTGTLIVAANVVPCRLPGINRRCGAQ